MESAATARPGQQCAISLRALGDAGAPADAERSKSDRPACGVPGSVNQMSPTSMRQPACASHWRLRAVDAFPLPRHANACRRLGAYRLAVRWHRSIVIGNQMSPTSSRQPVLALLLRAGRVLQRRAEHHLLRADRQRERWPDIKDIWNLLKDFPARKSSTRSQQMHPDSRTARPRSFRTCRTAAAYALPLLDDHRRERWPDSKSSRDQQLLHAANNCINLPCCTSCTTGARPAACLAAAVARRAQPVAVFFVAEACRATLA